MTDDVYHDGAEGERCGQCHSLLRQGGAPMVSIRQDDLEDVISILVQYVDCPEVWGDTIKRFEHAAGRTFAQMNAAARADRVAGVITPKERT